MTKNILLIGNNVLIAEIAKDLNDCGHTPIVATPANKAELSAAVLDASQTCQRMRVLTQARVSACSGSVGDFNVQVRVGSQTQSLEISQIVIAEDAERTINLGAHRLRPASSILPLTQYENLIRPKKENETLYGDATNVAFLMGLRQETSPESTRRAMLAAQHCQQTDKQAYILTGNLKVGDWGLEQLYRSSRDGGAVFIKFGHSRPKILMDDHDRVIIEFHDEIAGRPFRLTPDITVLDEEIEPTTYLQELIHIFDLETDPSGFAQADNVHRIGVATNRAGILVAGPAKNIHSRREYQMDGGAVALRSSIPIEPSEAESLTRAEIDVGSCIRCLTCHRLCPHGAIQVNTRVQVLPQACEACGMCAAECPRKAIQMPGTNDFNMGAERAIPNEPGKGDVFNPKMIAFCCSRSAFLASRLADCLYPALPRGLKVVEIPCAGSLSLDHLLASFQNGADGTLVLTCHSDNCHARHGNQRAWERAEMIQTQLADIGFERERLYVATLAANMGAAFADIVTDFEKKLREIGPSRLN